MDNKEDILQALEEFDRKKEETIPPLLEQYLRKIASTGETIFPWKNLKPVFIAKLDQSIKKFNEQVPVDHLPHCPNVENVAFDEMRKRIISSLSMFSGAPFTIQRLCELVVNPEKHYKRTDKFMRGIEKNIMVVSTVDPFGRKIVSESKFLVNGLDSNGVQAMDTPEKAHRFMPPPPANSPAVPSWSFSSAANNDPVESEWRPQPSDSSAEAVSASPSELWERSHDTKSDVTSKEALPFPAPAVSEAAEATSVGEKAPVVEASEGSPTKQVTSSADKDLNKEDPVSEGSSSTEPEVVQQSSDSSEPSSSDSKAVFQPVPMSSDGDVSGEESDEPARKTRKMSVESEETQEAGSTVPNHVEERRESNGFDTPVTSSEETSSKEPDNTTSSTDSKDTAVSSDSSTPTPEEAPSETPSSSSEQTDNVTGSTVPADSVQADSVQADSARCDTPSSDSNSSADSRSSVESRSTSSSSDQENTVSSMDVDSVPVVEASDKPQPSDQDSSSIECDSDKAVEPDQDSQARAGQQGVSSSDSVESAKAQEAPSSTASSTASPSQEINVSDSSTDSVPKPDNTDIDKPESHSSDEQVSSQSSLPEPMDTA